MSASTDVGAEQAQRGDLVCVSPVTQQDTASKCSGVERGACARISAVSAMVAVNRLPEMLGVSDCGLGKGHAPC